MGVTTTKTTTTTKLLYEMKASTFRQDRETGTGFIFTPETKTKKYTRWWLSRHQTSGNEELIPERWGKNGVSAMIAPIYCLKRVSKPQSREGKLRQRLGDSLNWQHWESTKAVGIHGTEGQQGDLERESWRSTEGLSLRYSGGISICRCSKNNLKGLGRMIPGYRDSTCPH